MKNKEKEAGSGPYYIWAYIKANNSVWNISSFDKYYELTRIKAMTEETRKPT